MSGFRPATAKDHGHVAWSGGIGVKFFFTMHDGTHSRVYRDPPFTLGHVRALTREQWFQTQLV